MEYAGLAIRQFELLPQKVPGVYDPVGVGIEELLDDHRFRVRQAGDQQGELAAVSVVDGGGREAKSHRRACGLRETGEQRQRDQQTFKASFHSRIWDSV